jgi:hypothetical protein
LNAIGNLKQKMLSDYWNDISVFLCFQYGRLVKMISLEHTNN